MNTFLLCLLISMNLNYTSQKTNRITKKTFNRTINEQLNTNPKSDQLTIYSFYQKDLPTNEKFGFIPLSNSYEYMQNDDLNSSFIDSQYLNQSYKWKEREESNEHYHELKPVYRKRFFAQIGIKETDRIYIYNSTLGKTKIYRVNQTKVVAFVNPYGSQFELRQADYQIGFRIEGTDLTTKLYHYAFVSVGENNPFVEGEFKPIRWQQVNNNQFPPIPEVKNTWDSLALAHYALPIRTHQYKTPDLIYYIQDLEREPQANINHGFIRCLIVVSSTDRKVIKTRVYRDSEGATPISLESQVKGYHNQWAGKLLKNKPPIVTGFLSMSFGCPEILFVDKDEPSIYFSCDNRH